MLKILSRKVYMFTKDDIYPPVLKLSPPKSRDKASPCPCNLTYPLTCRLNAPGFNGNNFTQSPDFLLLTQ